jgi:hypothetical protein
MLTFIRCKWFTLPALSIEAFKLLLNDAKKDNDFIKEEKYSHMKTSNNCKRFIRTHSIGSEEYIFGGIHLL